MACLLNDVIFALSLYFLFTRPAVVSLFSFDNDGKEYIELRKCLRDDRLKIFCWKVLTRGRTDHFSTEKSTNNQNYVTSTS